MVNEAVSSEATGNESGGATHLADSHGISPELLSSLGASLDEGNEMGHAEDAGQPIGEPSDHHEDAAAQAFEHETLLEGSHLDEEGNSKESESLFEITHNGEKVKLSKEELLEHAQKGFDYTSKTQTLAEQRKALEEEKERELAEIREQQETWNQKHQELQDLVTLKNQWDHYITQLERNDPGFYEQIQQGFQETQDQYTNPVVAAQIEALNSKMAQYDQVLQERENMAIRKEFETGYNQAIEKFKSDFETLGLNVDKEKIQKEWVDGAKTVEQAVLNVYASDMIKLLKSKGKVESVKKQVSNAQKVPTAGNQQMAKSVQPPSGSLSYDAILADVKRKYLR